ncbi:MAG: CopG family transcriptional regulator [Actinomycetota bacterium]
MKRKQIYIGEDLDSELRMAALAEGRSAAAIIRDAVRSYLARPAGHSNTDDPFLKLAGSFKGGPSNASVDHDRYIYRDAR